MSGAEVGIGIVGYGMMGKAHAYGYTVAPRIRDLDVTPRLRAISGRNAGAVARAASRYGVAEWTTASLTTTTSPRSRAYMVSRRSSPLVPDLT